jgi:hypothetical protein
LGRRCIGPIDTRTLLKRDGDQVAKHAGWKRAEKGARGDLLVTLSQDRWVRMQGLVDDLKAETSGQWLCEETVVEGFATGFGTLLVYVSAEVATNVPLLPTCSSVASTCTLADARSGCVMSDSWACLLLISAALLRLCNSLTKDLRMCNRIVFTTGEATKYTRRPELAEELITTSGREDCAMSMGLILSPVNSVRKIL